VRVLEYSIDPHAARKILSQEAAAVMFNLPLILWLTAGFLMFMSWIEVYHYGTKQVPMTTKRVQV
jgi:hypothetical protein